MEQPPFTDITACAHGEVYDVPDKTKFAQFGWRCLTNESAYKSGTLIGNWNEERYDVSHSSKIQPLPSPYNHYFQTTHKSDYTSNAKTEQLPEQVRLIGVTNEPRTFPGHQPEFDHPKYKNTYKELKTISMEAYKDPFLKKSIEK